MQITGYVYFCIGQSYHVKTIATAKTTSKTFAAADSINENVANPYRPSGGKD
jgi:hypothetical protein